MDGKKENASEVVEKNSVGTTCAKSSDLRIFLISFLAAVIVVACYHLINVVTESLCPANNTITAVCIHGEGEENDGPKKFRKGGHFRRPDGTKFEGRRFRRPRQHNGEKNAARPAAETARPAAEAAK